MATAKRGDRVKVEFSGTTREGQLITPEGEPQKLEFTVGEGQVIPGIEEAVIGMAPGENKSFEVPMDKGFGPYNKDMVAELDRKSIPPEQPVAPGQSMELHRADGQKLPAIILDVTEETVMIDANHPLAGRDLKFELKLLAIT